MHFTSKRRVKTCPILPMAPHFLRPGPEYQPQMPRMDTDEDGGKEGEFEQ